MPGCAARSTTAACTASGRAGTCPDTRTTIGRTCRCPATDPRPGVAWYRTTFRLQLPPGTDVSVGLTISDDPSKTYRAQIFLNGWNVGQYVNGVGPQSTFVLPGGILDLRGENTLAIAVIAGGTTSGGLGSVSLSNLATMAGGLAVRRRVLPALTRQTAQIPNGCRSTAALLLKARDGPSGSGSPRWAIAPWPGSVTQRGPGSVTRAAWPSVTWSAWPGQRDPGSVARSAPASVNAPSALVRDA